MLNQVVIIGRLVEKPIVEENENEILLVYLCRRIFGLRKRLFKTGIKS